LRGGVLRRVGGASPPLFRGWGRGVACGGPTGWVWVFLVRWCGWGLGSRGGSFWVGFWGVWCGLVVGGVGGRPGVSRVGVVGVGWGVGDVPFPPLGWFFRSVSVAEVILAQAPERSCCSVPLGFQGDFLPFFPSVFGFSSFCGWFLMGLAFSNFLSRRFRSFYFVP